MKKIFPLILITISCLMISACSKSKNDVNQKIVGTWNQRTTVNAFAGVSYWIKFNSDKTFQMKLNLFTDIVNPDFVPCSDSRIDYVIGHYKLDNNRLYLNGTYTTEQFDVPQQNCKGQLEFETNMNYFFSTKELVLGDNKAYERRHWMQKAD